MLAPTLTLDLSKYIETRLFDARPHIRGRRIPIWVIAHTARDNAHGVPELMDDFDLSESEVLAALLYYTQHQDDIEAQEVMVREAHRHFTNDTQTQNRGALR